MVTAIVRPMRGGAKEYVGSERIWSDDAFSPVSQNLPIWVRTDTQKPIFFHSYVPYRERIFHFQLYSKV